MCRDRVTERLQKGQPFSNRRDDYPLGWPRSYFGMFAILLPYGADPGGGRRTTRGAHASTRWRRCGAAFIVCSPAFRGSVTVPGVGYRRRVSIRATPAGWRSENTVRSPSFKLWPPLNVRQGIGGIGRWKRQPLP